MKCSICEFSCKQYIIYGGAHGRNSQLYRGSVMCRIGNNGFSKLSLLNIHLKKNYLKTPKICPDCGKTCGEHLKICKKNDKRDHESAVQGHETPELLQHHLGQEIKK